MSMVKAVSVAAIIVCLSPMAWGGISFQGLDDLTGGDFYSYALGVSADGSTVVGMSHSASGDQAFRWKNGVMTGLGYMPGGNSSEGFSVSSDGSVVVGRGNSNSGNEAFRWTQTGGMAQLGDLPTGNFWSEGFGVSSDGSKVVGRGQVEGHGQPSSYGEAYRWKDLNLNGQVDLDEKLDNHSDFSLGQLPGGYGSQALGISADGSVVVGQGTSASGDEAFRWTQAGGMVGLGDLTGGSFRSSARAVSADGSVVVGQATSASGNEAFRWTQTEGMVDLGDLPGGTPPGSGNLAWDVSADGSIVVGMANFIEGQWSAPNQKAFIWDATNKMRSLQDMLVDDFGVNLEDWMLLSATGISDDGRTFVGYGRNPNGDIEAWVATIPEPATMFLLALGGIVFTRRQ